MLYFQHAVFTLCILHWSQTEVNMPKTSQSISQQSLSHRTTTSRVQHLLPTYCTTLLLVTNHCSDMFRSQFLAIITDISRQTWLFLERRPHELWPKHVRAIINLKKKTLCNNLVIQRLKCSETICHVDCHTEKFRKNAVLPNSQPHSSRIISRLQSLGA